MQEFLHNPVLFEEVINLLNIKPDGVYMDGTIGGGGHFAGIYSRLGKEGKIIGFDRDIDAVNEVNRKFSNLEKKAEYHIIKGSFSEADIYAKDFAPGGFDGILLDLGVSSYQFDAAHRGFSYSGEGRIDMRMDLDLKISAWDVINAFSERELSDIFFKFGEERYSRQIARAIIKYRQQKSIDTTLELADITAGSVPSSYRRDGHPARKVFQAVRIFVNGEMEALEKGLKILPEMLKENGRLAVITFHSMEDRLVKQKFNNLERPCTCPADIPFCVCGKKQRHFNVTKKPVIPSAKEQEKNHRSRSAKLRVIERMALNVKD